MPAKKSLIGRRFGRLIVQAEGPPIRDADGISRTRSKCRCDCGNVVLLRNSNLGRCCHSCGCLNSAEARRERFKTHGLTKTPTYAAWLGLRARCYNPSEMSYADYGGRGIKVCSGWRHSFESFLHDVGIRPRRGLSLHRINNDGNYSCGHCSECVANDWPLNAKWATFIEQSRHRRSNRMLTVGNKTGCLSELCEWFGVKRSTAVVRFKLGWTAEQVFGLDSKKRGRSSIHMKTDGETSPGAVVTFSKADFGDALKQCKVGEPEDFIVRFVPSAVRANEVTGKIVNVQYAEEEEEYEEPVTETPAKGRMKGVPPALRYPATA